MNLLISTLLLISFAIPNSEKVIVKVYDVTGREIVTLADGFFEAGEHKLDFDGSKLSSGVYFARLEAGNFNKTHKMILLK